MGTAEVETAGVEPAEIIKDDPPGARLVSGFREAATENAEVGGALQENLGARGVSPFLRRLFEIDGSKGLLKAVDLVFGGDHPVQLCRNHKLRNVPGRLSKVHQYQARTRQKGAFQREAEAGESRLEEYAGWLEQDWASAATSLREGLGELFTINGLGLPSKLRRCLVATVFNTASANLRRIIGYE